MAQLPYHENRAGRTLDDGLRDAAKGQAAEADLFEKKQEDVFTGFTPEHLAPPASIQVLPMYHPAALLRNPNLKKDAWEDMKLLRDTLKQPA